MTILEALDDPELFALLFAAATWKPWKAFLGALFGLALDAEALATYQAHTGRSAPPSVPFKEAALIIGRRGGKSRVLALIAVFLGCFRNYAPFLAPGEVGTVAIIAADRRQARSIFRFVSGLLNAVGLLAAMVEDETADVIRLNNNVQIEIATASFRVTRGYAYVAVLADELAFWRSDDSANPDVEIIAAIRPGLATIPGAMLLMASSPYRRRGVLWNTYQRHYGRDDARVLVWKATSLEMNPGLDAAIVAEAYQEDHDNAAAEFGAEFRSDLADFVPRPVVEAAIAPGRFELPPLSPVRYVAFIDPSGGSAGDAMTLAIAHRDAEGTLILDCIRERRPPFSPEDVVRDFAESLKAYRVHQVTGDRWGGEFVREPFRKLGITYKLSEQPKSDIYRECLPLLNAGKIQLLDNPRLVTQLCNLERRTSRAGKDSIDHPPNQHDDIANAVCGALLIAVGRTQMRFDPAEVQALVARGRRRQAVHFPNFYP